ncbi:MAG: hypothetical protein ACREDA_07045 [Methylocella sp.]
MRRHFRVTRDLTGNLPALPAVYPDAMAPVVRVARDGERELTMTRWGFPPPPNLGSVPAKDLALGLPKRAFRKISRRQGTADTAAWTWSKHAALIDEDQR